MVKKTIFKLRKIAVQSKISESHIQPETSIKRGHCDETADHQQEIKRKRPKKDSSEKAFSNTQESHEQQTRPSGTESDNNFNDEFTVYIEGLPFSASENDVIKFFEPAGIVQSVRLPKWHDSGKLRGYGHVKFCAPEMATKALEQDGMYMQNRFIKVDRPMVPRVLQKKEITQIVRPPGCHTVFVKNIPYDCTQDDVKESFMVCGKINNVRLAVWGHTNQLKGFGYVEFKSEESAEIAVKKSGAILVKGRPVICDFETNQPKRSFKSLSEIQKANARKTDEATSRNIPNMLS